MTRGVTETLAEHITCLTQDGLEHFHDTKLACTVFQIISVFPMPNHPCAFMFNQYPFASKLSFEHR